MRAPGSSNSIDVPLRWRDLDHLGHVYHGTMLTLLDEARTRWFAAQFGVDSSDSYVVARIEIDFLGETRIESGHVSVEFIVERVGTTSITSREVARTADGTAVAEAVVTAVLWDAAARRPRPITPKERDRMENPESSAKAGPRA